MYKEQKLVSAIIKSPLTGYVNVIIQNVGSRVATVAPDSRLQSLYAIPHKYQPDN